MPYADRSDQLEYQAEWRQRKQLDHLWLEREAERKARWYQANRARLDARKRANLAKNRKDAVDSNLRDL